MDPTKLDFPEGTKFFINESLYAYYCGLWNKCKKLKDMGKFNVFFLSNGTIKFKKLENDRAKPITHAADLKKMFPDNDIDHLYFVCLFVCLLFVLIFLIRFELFIYTG